MEARVRINDKTLKLTNLEKILYPAAGFSKAQVLNYYARMAQVLVPHLAGRPLTLKRFPEGVEAGYFYEKRCPGHRPEWMPVSKSLNYCRVEDAASLLWIANLASLEIHPLLAQDEDLLQPTMVVFDLDPGPPAGLRECGRVALALHDTLHAAGLQVWVKTSGGAGLHCCLPLNTLVTYDQTKNFARRVARLLEKHYPGQVTSGMKKALRPGKVFVDWSQNDEHKTTVSVYSLRARPQPTVSLPVSWEELRIWVNQGRPEGLVFLADEAVHRVQQQGDLFHGVLTVKQQLIEPHLPG